MNIMFASFYYVIKKNVRIIGNPVHQDSFFLKIVLEWSQKF